MRMASYFPPWWSPAARACKGTLIELMAWDPEAFGFSVSHTTRAPRPGEEYGVHYHFAEVDTMKAEIEQGKFLKVPTSRQLLRHLEGFRGDVQSWQDCGSGQRRQGVRSVKEANLGAKCLWVEAPSMEAPSAGGPGHGDGREDPEAHDERAVGARTTTAAAGPAPLRIWSTTTRTAHTADSHPGAHGTRIWGGSPKNPCAALRGVLAS